MFKTLINAVKVGFKYRNLINHPVIKMIVEVVPTIVQMATVDKKVTLEGVIDVYLDIKPLLPDNFTRTATDVEVQRFVESLFAAVISGQKLLEE